MTSNNRIKVLPPRPLTNNESSHSLAQWKINFRQFMKKDDAYASFLKSTVTWDASKENYGFIRKLDEREPAQVSDDLQDFLHMLASYMPHGFITDRILQQSTSFDTAFKIIEESFGLLPTQETFCDFLSLNRLPNEPYRQFYERILSFMVQHLVPFQAKGVNLVNGVAVPPEGDKISVSLMNLVTLFWIKQIHPEFMNIVRTEYSKELRDNVPIASLVPRIALSADALLMKYDKTSAVNRISDDQQVQGQVDDAVSGDVMRIKTRTQTQHDRKPKFVKGSYTPAVEEKKFCPGCYYLGTSTKANVQFKHFPKNCPRSPAIVALLEAEESDCFQDQGNDLHKVESEKFNQNAQETDAHQPPYAVRRVNTQSQAPVAASSCILSENILLNKSRLEGVVLRLTSSKVQKISSPYFRFIINGHSSHAVIDEGSELNCIDMGTARIANIEVESSLMKAKAAGNQSMQVVGQTKSDVLLDIIVNKSSARVNLGACLVVENLGTPLIIGQPGKVKHEIVTQPHLNVVTFKDSGGKLHTINSNKVEADILRIFNDITLYPGDVHSFNLPPALHNSKRVIISPRKCLLDQGMQQMVLPVKNDVVTIPNNSNSVMILKKNAHAADIRRMVSYDEAIVSKLYKVDSVDDRPIQSRQSSEVKQNFVNDVVLDPDNVMTPTWRQKFLQLCLDYKDIIQYNPGSYNGRYGFVTTSLELTSTPPPNNRCYVPKYNKQQMDLLADKMDELLEQKILVEPEEIGVGVKFTSPSMLVPKPGGGWRVVTDFTQLNNYVRKTPALSPGIEETKLQIAAFKYITCIDLSQFYFQNSVASSSSQYLGTVHPYRGTLVYTVRPMGLRNSSELCYERLTRIFGDMQRARQLCRQADALIVGGMSLQEMFVNLHEVFSRLRDCNMTIKPSKLEIGPISTSLFGWEYSGQSWFPGNHKLNPLVSAAPPGTVKQMRSWLGAAKQLSAGLHNYAVLFRPLEQVVAGRGSAERVIWTEQLEQQFKDAKNMLPSMQKIYYPIPTDQIYTYSDFAQDSCSVGGRLEFERIHQDGSTQRFHGGLLCLLKDKSPAMVTL